MATYYSSHNAAGGGAGTIGSPFTLQELFNTVSSGDIGLVMNTGTYAPTGIINVNVNTGSVTARPTIRGVASDGTDDGTVSTISGSGLPSSTTLLQIANGIDFLRLENLRFTASKNYGIDINSNGCIFKNVRVDNSVSHGFYQQTLTDVTMLINCEIDTNGGAGWTGGFVSRGNVLMIGGSVHNNTSHGVRCSINGSLHNVLIFKNGSHGVMVDLNVGEFGPIIIHQCTIATNTGNGIDINSGIAQFNVLISDTILYENTAFGIDLNGCDPDMFTFTRMCSHNNASGSIDTGSLPTDTITNDPAFANESSGSEDYTPSLTSLIRSISTQSGIGGINYNWIGAIKPTTNTIQTVSPSLHPLAYTGRR